MNTAQKRAWFCVFTIILCCIGYVALIPFLGPRAAFGAFGIFGLNGFSVFIGKKEKLDERDKTIHRRGVLAGGMSSYGSFFICCTLIWWIASLQGYKQVPVALMGEMMFIGGIVFYSVYCITILVLYGRKVEADNV